MQTRDLDIENVQSQWIEISRYSIKSSRRSTIAMKERQGALACPFCLVPADSSVTREGSFDQGGMRLLLRPFPPVEGSRTEARPG